MSLVQDVLSCRCNNHFTGEVYSCGGFMGVKMSGYIKSKYFRQSILAFTGIPLLVWIMGNLPDRTLLKDIISGMAILAFWQMIGQFFLARTNRVAVEDLTMSNVVKYHKIIGYIFVTGLLVHPILLVVPRFFESGVSPGDAFLTIITTFTSQGVVLGIIAWCLMLTLGITSLARNILPMRYTTWRIFHGILAMMFISIAAWHVIDLGRHSTLTMSILIAVLTACGVLLLLKTYTSNFFKKGATR